MAGIAVRHELLQNTPDGPIVAVNLTGTFGPGSEGNPFAVEIAGYLRSTIQQTLPVAGLFDLTELDYVWGDAIAGLAMPLMVEKDPIHFLPSAIVVTGHTAQALQWLLEPRCLFGIAGIRLFSTREEAVADLQATLSGRPRCVSGPEPVPQSPAEWPTVEATLISATVESNRSDAGPASVLHVVPILELIWGMVDMVRRHRACFKYTYDVGGKTYYGEIRRWVWFTDASPKLMGKDVGEKIRVRFNPQKPEASEVAAEGSAAERR
jgi:hypothetical protein